MKNTLKNLTALLLIAVPAFTACNKEFESAEPQLKDGEVTLTILPPSQEALTKVATSETDTKFNITGWNVGDSIFVYQTNSDHNALSDEVKFTCTDATKGTFAGDIAGKKNIAGSDLQVSELNLASTKKMNTSMKVVAADLSTFASTDFNDVCLLVGERSSSDAAFQMLLKGNVIAIDNKTASDKEAAIKALSGGDGFSWVTPIFGYTKGEWVSFYRPSGTFSDVKFTVAKNDVTYVLLLVTKEEENTYGIAVESDGIEDDKASIAAMKPIAAGTNGKMWTVTIEDILLPGKFTVASGKQVQFTRGNLYYSTTDGKYHIETAQNATYGTGDGTYDATHVCHFFWTKDATNSYVETYPDDLEEGTTDVPFFAESKGGLTVDGRSGLYALSSEEYQYLFGTNATRSGKYTSSVSITIGSKTVSNCVVIAPDACLGGYTFDNTKTSYTAAEWATAESAGLVCLPAAGCRGGSDVYDGGSVGDYCSATPGEDDRDSAYILNFEGSYVDPADCRYRGCGYSVRLVCSVK